MRSSVTRSTALVIVGLLLVGCGFVAPAREPKLPADFPADFPAPPSATLVSVSGPMPFLPAEVRGTTLQWTSSLSRAELEAFYAQRHGAWRLRQEVPAPSAGPFTGALPTTFVFIHDTSGMVASVGVGMSGPGLGTMVVATIIPRIAPAPSPTP